MAFIRILKNRKYIIAALLGFMLISGILFLMMMQLEWITQAAKTTTREIRRNIFSNVTQAVEKVNQKLDAIFSLMQISYNDYKSKNWSAFYQNMSLLKNNSQFLDYIEQIVLLPVKKEDISFSYSLIEDKFIQTILPSGWEDIYTIAENQDMREIVKIMNQRLLYLIPISNMEIVETSRGFMDYDAFLVIHFNLPRFYTLLLQSYLKNTLTEYMYRIIDNNNAIFISEGVDQGTISPGRKPDFIFPLRYPILHLPRYQNSEKEMDRDGFRTTSGLRFSFQRENERNQEGDVDSPGLHVEIYYPGGPLDAIVAGQTLVNRIISISILFIFILGIMFLYRTYIKIDRQREREQEFIATISHELRTPLAVIQSASENLSSGIVQKKNRIQDYGNTIQEHVKRLSHMVENILLYAGLQSRSGNIKKTDTWISLDEIMQDILTTFDELTKEKKTKLIFNKDIKNLLIKVDALSLKLLLENLIMNALLHGTYNNKDDNEIRLFIKRKVIRGVTIIIEDNGPGILSKERKKVFRPFYRGSYSIQAQIRGSGLGLHLVKRVTEMLGGMIRLESPYKDITGKVKSGVRIVLELPLEVKDE